MTLIIYRIILFAIFSKILKINCIDEEIGLTVSSTPIGEYRSNHEITVDITTTISDVITDPNMSSSEIDFEMLNTSTPKVIHTNSTTYLPEDEFINDTENINATENNDNVGEVKSSGEIQCEDGMFCFPKCCPEGKLFSFQKRGCIEVPKRFENFTPIIKSKFGLTVNLNKPMQPLIKQPNCDYYAPSDYPGWVLQNGEFYIQRERKTMDANSFCVDIMYAPAGNVWNFQFECGEDYSVSNMVCFDEDEEDSTYYAKGRRIIQPIAVFISCLSLSIIIASYFGIEQIRKLQGTAGPLLICHAVALLTGNILLFIINLPITHLLSAHVCTTIAITLHYSFLSAFFWLNVMCFDMWLMIRGSYAYRRIGENKHRLIYYNLYAWGLPTVIVTISTIINFLPKSSLPCGFPTPNYGVGQCWFPNDVQILFIYFSGIAAVLFTINIGFLLHIAYLLWNFKIRFMSTFKSLFEKQNKQKDLDLSNSPNSHVFNANHKQMFKNRFMIFAVLAFIWIFEVLSLTGGPSEMWALTNLFNSLQGFFMFLIFISTKAKIKLIRDAVRNKLEVIRTGSSAVTSTFRGDEASNEEMSVVSMNLSQVLNLNNVICDIESATKDGVKHNTD